MRTVLQVNNETNLNVLRILTKWSTIKQDITIKLITSYKRYKNFRVDHAIHKYLEGKTMKEFWCKFNPFTKWLFNKMEDDINQELLLRSEG